MRHFLTTLFRILLKVFYRRIEIVGLDRVPRDRPVIFAVNHPNGLVDPLFVLCFTPRPVSFLAKAPLFSMPVIGYFVRTFQSVPVFRKQDKVEGSLDETFARAGEILRSGGSIAIFPEGTTHSDARMRELKTGAARIALAAAGRAGELRIIPTGIYYTAKQRFRSEALVAFGEPIVVAGSDESAESVRALTSRIDAALDALTLQADSHAALELIGRAEDLFTAEERQPLAEELELRRRFIEGYHYLRERDPVRLARLESAVRQMISELGRRRIEPHELAPRFDAGTITRVLILFPVALIGAFVHYPPYLIVDALARRFARDANELMATVKFVAALLIYPLTWLTLGAAVWWLGNGFAAVLTLAILPLLGLVALHVFEEIDDAIGRTRALLHRLLAGSAHKELLAKRLQIRKEFMAVAEEIARVEQE